MKKLLSIALALGLAIPSMAAPKAKAVNNAVNDEKTFISQLMQRMTIEEKIGQLNLQVAGDITTGSAQDTQVGGLISEGKLGGVFNLKGVDAIRKLQDIAVKQTRLGIPLIVGMDVIHGYETIFPIPLAQSMSWDMQAIEQAASIAAREATADGINWVYSPMVDISVDPRWGRVAEGGGEDPYLGSLIAKAYIQGYQGTQPYPIATDKALTSVKHYALYGAVEAGRDYNTVDMSHWRMYNQYFPPYKAAVEAGAATFMTSFNLVDGIPATANKWLIDDVLRKQWGFDGMIVTDYGSIGEATVHVAGNTLEDASVRSLLAGTDMDMCSQGFLYTLKSALDKGRITEADIDKACRRVLQAKWRMGLFHDPYRYCDPKRRAKDIYTDANRQAARDFAAETFVLLKNQNDLLPLKKQGKIALIGPLANDRANVAGTWCVAYTPERYATVKEGLERAVAGKAEVLYAQGSNLTRDEAYQVASEFGKTIKRGDEAQLKAEALRVAQEADVIVCAMGECADMSGESSSRADLALPDVQMELLQELAKLGKPVVLLNFSGRPTILTWEQEHIDAILNVWFGGSETADAIADVLFGDKSPSGRLTMTFPKTMGQIPLYYNHWSTGRPVEAGAKAYRKYASNYLDVRNDALYPFGYGLTYSKFAYSPAALSATTMGLGGKVQASVTITNAGSREATEVAQLYIRNRAADVSMPVKELRGFERITLQPGESRNVTFTIDRTTLSRYTAEGEQVTDRGQYDIMIGSDSEHVETLKLSVE